jgi:hypothetical protein
MDGIPKIAMLDQELTELSRKQLSLISIHDPATKSDISQIIRIMSRLDSNIFQLRKDLEHSNNRSVYKKMAQIKNNLWYRFKKKMGL